MSIESLYHFFFESFAGVGILVLAGLVISVLVCVIMEWRTRQAFKDRGEVEADDDDFTFFDDDDDEDEAEEVADYEQTISHSQLHHIGHADMPAAEDEKKDEEDEE